MIGNVTHGSGNFSVWPPTCRGRDRDLVGADNTDDLNELKAEVSLLWVWKVFLDIPSFF